MVGMGNVYKQVGNAGFNTVGTDKKYASYLQLGKPKGTKVYMCGARRLRRGACFWLGVECTTWVWMARSVFRRSMEDPDGDQSSSQVKEANEVRDVVCFIMMLLKATGAHFCIEQPK